MSNPKILHEKLLEKKKTLALAESCTGGHLSALFTAIPDASRYFLGSIISYSNELKRELLKVSQETLRTHGAVSRETANEMLLGLMKCTDADFGIAITGIAGPSGGTREKQVGTVYIATCARGKKPHIVHCQFEGSRQRIIESSCLRACTELDQLLSDESIKLK